MEAFEGFVALAMEAEGLVVQGATKFKLKKLTRNKNAEVYQEHGYEVDLVAARRDKLVLATVKSFLGSGGVKPKEVTGEAGHASSGGYKMLNNLEVRDGIVAQACEVYGYKPEQVEMRLYAGKFSGVNGEAKVREWCNSQIVGSGPIQVINVVDVVDAVNVLADSTTYRDNAALVAVKVLNAAAAEKTKLAKPQNIDLGGNAESVKVNFPIGCKVVSQSDGVSGEVFGYSNQGTKNPYLKVRNDETGKSYIRAVSTMKKTLEG